MINRKYFLLTAGVVSTGVEKYVRPPYAQYSTIRIMLMTRDSSSDEYSVHVGESSFAQRRMFGTCSRATIAVHPTDTRNAF